MKITDLDELKGAPVVDDDGVIRERLGEHGARITVLEKRFANMEVTLAGQDVKLDKIIERQVAADARRDQSEEDADKRAKRIAWIAGVMASLGSGVVVAVIAEVIRYAFWHGGALP